MHSRIAYIQGGNKMPTETIKKLKEEKEFLAKQEEWSDRNCCRLDFLDVAIPEREHQHKETIEGIRKWLEEQECFSEDFFKRYEGRFLG